jgi:hypothetical protein
MHEYTDEQAAKPLGLMAGANAISTKAMNPTLAQNIDSKIQYHRDEIERLLAIKGKFPPDFLGMNLRDLREAMQF